MTCPRCGNEWDVSKSPCARCGLLVHLPNSLRSATRPSSSSQKQQDSSSGRNDNPGKFPVKPDDSRPLTSGSSLSSAQREPLQSRANPQQPPLGNPFEQRQTGSLPAWGVGASQGTQETPLPPMRDNLDLSSFRESSAGHPRSEPTSSLKAPLGRESEGGVQKSVPSRPNPLSQAGQMRSSGVENGVQPSLRAKRLVTDGKKEVSPARPVEKAGAGGDWETNAVPFRSLVQNPQSGPQNPESSIQPPDSLQLQRVSPANPNMSSGFALGSNQRESVSEDQGRMLMPGTTLRNGRYQLRELLNRQEWQVGVYEATWSALDAQRRSSQVIITEVVVPESNSMSMQSMLRTATMALTSVSRHTHVPTLWDAFSDQGRNFFVFEPIEGESLSSRMKRTGRALSEQEVIECSVQMAEILELLGQQMPPMVHGLIRPEHIIIGRVTNLYMLTNFSIILAGGATQFVSGLDRARVSPYMSPEFVRGTVDVRSDLYALVASAYHVATGSVPSTMGASGTVPSAQRLNSNISASFDQLLTKGLRSIIAQRYQRAADLRSDLLAIHSVYGTSTERNAPVSVEASFVQPISVSLAASRDTAAQMLPNLLVTEMSGKEPGQKLLLPRPEELPPMLERNDTLLAILWIAGIIICLVIVVAVSHLMG